jgi:hypothetical protein
MAFKFPLTATACALRLFATLVSAGGYSALMQAHCNHA